MLPVDKASSWNRTLKEKAREEIAALKPEMTASEIQAAERLYREFKAAQPSEAALMFQQLCRVLQKTEKSGKEGSA